MKTKKWYEIRGDSPTEKNLLLAKVASQSNAWRVAQALQEIYQNVRIK